MIKGISVWAFDPNRPLSEVFRMAKDHGFDSVEVAVAEDGPITLDATEDECRRITDSAAASGIRLSSLASGLGWQYPLTSSNPDVSAKAKHAVSRSLEIAEWLGVDAILIVPGGVGVDFKPGFVVEQYDVAYANAQAALRELRHAALRHSVTMAVENVWNKFLLSPLEMRDFIDSIDADSTGAYFDVGNVIGTGYPEHWIRILGKRIARIHLKDFKREVGTLAGFCDLLDGSVDYPEVMKALREIGYDGPLTAEYFNCESELGKISEAIDNILAM